MWGSKTWVPDVGVAQRKHDKGEPLCGVGQIMFWLGCVGRVQDNLPCTECGLWWALTWEDKSTVVSFWNQRDPAMGCGLPCFPKVDANRPSVAELLDLG